ncbi:MAG: UDP-N-acetylmuramoyl-tripeptide--D-alanyl-D-alanine ligase [Eubacterium sp.]|nr:UDP-N-acetylmuramoyl-tripeptide--D-alanyl-D-alanine ligase [Eubacterium sp.]
MVPIAISEIAEAVNGRFISGGPGGIVTSVCTDSREAGGGALFIPLIGENHDAHRFIPQAFENGCRDFMVSEPDKAPEGANVILVEDTLDAMQALAKHCLEKLDIRRVAVTGSVGKTTTRDMLYYIMSEKYVTGKPIKNFNNQVGVPITVFSFEEGVQAGVFEEGMDHAGEIHRVTNIVRPEVAVITNIGVSHIEFFENGREGIRAAKLEITDFMDSSNVLVINASNDMLSKDGIEGDFRIVTVGYEDDFDWQVSGVKEHGLTGTEFILTHDGTSRKIELPVAGEHNAVNAALAIAAASEFGIDIDQAQNGLRNLDITGSRLRTEERGGITVIDDSYNAAPDSMISAVKTLANSNGKRKIAILADMNELGSDSETLHKNVGAAAAHTDIDILMTVGEKARAIASGAEAEAAAAGRVKPLGIFTYGSLDEMKNAADVVFAEGDVVLLKGSNSTGIGNAKVIVFGE